MTAARALHSADAVQVMHQELFGKLPAGDWFTDESEAIVPGQLCQREVHVGQHVAPAFASMPAYKHSGFSVDASVRIQADDRAGLERLLRYCARPPFSMQRLRKQGATLVYRCTRQHSEPVGAKQADLVLTPLELIDRIRRSGAAPTHAPAPLLRRAGTEFAAEGRSHDHGAGVSPHGFKRRPTTRRR